MVGGTAPSDSKLGSARPACISLIYHIRNECPVFDPSTAPDFPNLSLPLPPFFGMHPSRACPGLYLLYNAAPFRAAKTVSLRFRYAAARASLRPLLPPVMLAKIWCTDRSRMALPTAAVCARRGQTSRALRRRLVAAADLQAAVAHQGGVGAQPLGVLAAAANKGGGAIDHGQGERRLG